jgi:DNA-directed RNA polymerase subunit P
MIVMPYACGKCGKTVSLQGLESLPGVKCPYCGYRVLYKIRPPIVKKVKSQ